MALSHDKKTRATVVQRYHFSSGLRRMAATVLLEEEDAPQPVPVALMKGAPEVVRQFLKQVRPVCNLLCSTVIEAETEADTGHCMVWCV